MQKDTDIIRAFFKKNWLLWITISFILIVPVIFYILNFNAGLSYNNSDWGNFGSYIGGVLTPLLTFATIIILIISNKTQTHLLKEQIVSQKRQIEILEKEKKRIEIEKGIFEVQKFVKYFMEKPVPISIILEYFESQRNEYTYSYDEITNCIRGKKGTEYIILKEENIFVFIKGIIRDKGLEWVKSEVIKKDIYLLKPQLNSFKSQCDYLIGLAIKLKEMGTDIHVLKYYLSTIYEQYDLMGKLGIVSEANLINLKLLQNIKAEWTKLSYSVSDLIESVEDAPKIELIDDSSFQNNFEFIIKLNDKEYGISRGIWKEIVEN